MSWFLFSSFFFFDFGVGHVCVWGGFFGFSVFGEGGTWFDGWKESLGWICIFVVLMVNEWNEAVCVVEDLILGLEESMVEAW